MILPVKDGRLNTHTSLFVHSRNSTKMTISEILKGTNPQELERR